MIYAVTTRRDVRSTIGRSSFNKKVLDVAVGSVDIWLICDFTKKWFCCWHFHKPHKKDLYYVDQVIIALFCLPISKNKNTSVNPSLPCFPLSIYIKSNNPNKRNSGVNKPRKWQQKHCHSARQALFNLIKHFLHRLWLRD